MVLKTQHPGACLKIKYITCVLFTSSVVSRSQTLCRRALIDYKCLLQRVWLTDRQHLALGTHRVLVDDNFSLKEWKEVIHYGMRSSWCFMSSHSIRDPPKLGGCQNQMLTVSSPDPLDSALISISALWLRETIPCAVCS